MSGVSPSPSSMRIREIDLDVVDRLCFVFFLGLEDELFKNGIASSNDAGKDIVGQWREEIQRVKNTKSDEQLVSVCTLSKVIDHHTGSYFS